MGVTSEAEDSNKQDDLNEYLLQKKMWMLHMDGELFFTIIIWTNQLIQIGLRGAAYELWISPFISNSNSVIGF